MKTENSKIVLVVGVVVLSLGLLAFVLLRGGPQESGTIQPVTKQIHPSARGHKDGVKTEP